MKFPGRKPNLHGIVREQERQRRAEQHTKAHETGVEPDMAVMASQSNAAPQSFDVPSPAFTNAGIGPSDIWRHADRLMQMHGEDAALVVADLAGARFADGDLDGFTLWTRIGAAITDWSRQRPGCTDCVN